MTRVIHKFTHPVAAHIMLPVPYASTFLHVDRDTRNPDVLAFWFEVTPGAPHGNRSFIVIGTGQEIPREAVKHVGSVKMGGFIWHVYEARQ